MAKKASIPILLLVLLAIGAILFNGWVFGWLNHGNTGYLRMSISELEVPAQPFSIVFRSFDFISGTLLFISASAILISSKKHYSHWLAVVLCLVALLGALTIFDVTHPLDCVRYNNPDCVSATALNEVSHTDYLHDTESYFTAYVSGFLAIATLIWLHSSRKPQLLVVAAAGLLIGTLVTLIVLDNTQQDIFAGAIVERLWNLLVSADVILVAFSVRSSLKSFN